MEAVRTVVPVEVVVIVEEAGTVAERAEEDIQTGT